VNPQVRRFGQVQVLMRQRDEFTDTEAGGDRRQQDGVVTTARPR
jgi:hypothetical protein